MISDQLKMRNEEVIMLLSPCHSNFWSFITECRKVGHRKAWTALKLMD